MGEFTEHAGLEDSTVLINPNARLRARIGRHLHWKAVQLADRE